jgi:hypothetical protein
MKLEKLNIKNDLTTPRGIRQFQVDFERWREVLNVNIDSTSQFVSVSDVDSPDLSAYKGANQGNIIIVYDSDYFTGYAWSTSGTADSPFIVTGDGGFWVAIFGRYINTEGRVNSLTASRLMASDANKGLSSADLIAWILGTTNRIEITDNLDGTVTIKTADALAIIDFTNAAHTHQDAPGGAQLDHGLSMTAASLLDDDHPNLHNDARGDARYYTQAQVDSLVVSGLNSILCADGDVLVGDGEVMTGV